MFMLEIGARDDQDQDGDHASWNPEVRISSTSATAQLGPTPAF